jgi:hypothetical protein
MYRSAASGPTLAGMARNLALVHARHRAGLSQDGLALRIRQTGHRLGHPNDCNRANVARWEGGGHPQPHYVLLLEATLGTPATDLGLAYESYGMDRDQMLAEAGLDAEPQVPDPAARYGRYGPLTGIWRSEYEYPSSSRGGTFTGRHMVLVLQRGAHLNIRSLPGQHSRLSLDLSVNGQVAQGTWTEHTAEGGYYRGSVYTGTIQLELNQAGDRLKGRWLGFGRDPGEINDGPWQFTRVDDKIDADTRKRWDRDPDAEG